MELSINFLSIGIDRNAQVFHFAKPEASVTLIICKFPSLLVKVFCESKHSGPRKKFASIKKIFLTNLFPVA
jgi:hypothetical protein